MTSLGVALLLVVVACRLTEHAVIATETTESTTLGELSKQKGTDNPTLITPGHSIRLPGKGVGTWKEISLSRSRGTKARYSTDGAQSSSYINKASNMWTITSLVLWKSISEIMNLNIPFR